MTDHSKYDAVDLLLDKHVVAFHRGLAHAVGDAVTGLLLSQFWYWSRIYEADRDGWFYITQEQILDQTALTRREQETARRNLRELQLIEETKHGLPARLWIRVNRPAVKRILQEYAETQWSKREQLFQDGGFRHPGLSETARLDRTSAPSKAERNRPANTKTTPKTSLQRSAASSINRDEECVAAAEPELVEELRSYDLNRADALRLASTKPDECRRQLEYLRYLPARNNPGGWLRDAIENEHGAPAGYHQAKKRDEILARRAEQSALESARMRHEVAHRESFFKYLTHCEGELRKTHPEAFSAFMAQDAQERARLERAPLTPRMLAEVLEDFDRLEHYLQRFERYFSQQPDCAILGFWDWDSMLNPTPLKPGEGTK